MQHDILTIIFGVLDIFVLLNITFIIILCKFIQHIQDRQIQFPQEFIHISKNEINDSYTYTQKSWIYIILILLNVLNFLDSYIISILKETLFSSIFMYMCKILIDSKYDSYWGLGLTQSDMDRRAMLFYEIFYKTSSLLFGAIVLIINRQWARCVWNIIYIVISSIITVPALDTYIIVRNNLDKTLKSKLIISSFTVLILSIVYITTGNIMNIIKYGKYLYKYISPVEDNKYWANIGYVYWWIIRTYVAWYVYIQAPFRYNNIGHTLDDLNLLNLYTSMLKCVPRFLVKTSIKWFAFIYSLIKKFRYGYETIESDEEGQEVIELDFF